MRDLAQKYPDLMSVSDLRFVLAFALALAIGLVLGEGHGVEASSFDGGNAIARPLSY